VDEALCFGWIDGIRKRIDEERYMIRFTPRRARSIWSAVNIGRVAVLTEEGRMRPAGIAAFAARREDRSGIYSYEQRERAKLDPAFEKRFRANKRAWASFEAMPASYRQAAIRWVMTAKKEETRERRLATLMKDCRRSDDRPAHSEAAFDLRDARVRSNRLDRPCEDASPRSEEEWSWRREAARRKIRGSCRPRAASRSSRCIAIPTPIRRRSSAGWGRPSCGITSGRSRTCTRC
jgi:hypothetical protein